MTPAQRTAWNALQYLTTCTNWSDGTTLSECVKLEKRQGLSLSEARLQVITQWLAGVTAPDTPARDIYWYRPGCMMAFMLGVSHAVERLHHTYNRQHVKAAIDACKLAEIEA